MRENIYTRAYRNETYPGFPTQDESRQPDGCGSQQRRRSCKQPPLQAPNFKEVLCHCPHLDIVVIGFAYPPQIMHGIRIAQIPVKGFEHISLRLQDLRLRVRCIRAAQKMSDRRRDNLFEFCCNEHARDPDKLEFGKRNDACGEEAVNDIDTKEQRFRE
jgi:hypothetical protein